MEYLVRGIVLRYINTKNAEVSRIETELRWRQGLKNKIKVQSTRKVRYLTSYESKFTVGRLFSVYH